MAAEQPRTASSQPVSETFGETLLEILNHGGLCLMISIGHRTGLFDALADGEWMTSTELAEKANLDERYVREWLGAMATGRIVEIAAHGHFRLAPEHAAWLTRAAGADNIAVFAQYIAELGSVESRIVDRFHHGGGVGYEHFQRFHEIMAEDSGQSVLPVIETHVLDLVPGLRSHLREGIEVLDAGCGRGKALMLLAERFGKSFFTGIDLSPDAIDWARGEADRIGLKNIRFQQADLSNFDNEAPRERFDLVFTFDAVHDQARPGKLLAGIYKALKTEGVYIMQDIHAHSDIEQNLDHPLGPLLYTVSTMHCMTVSLAQGGDGLGAMWGRELAEEKLREAGFNRIEIKRFEHDIQNDWYVVRKAAATYH